MLLARGQRACQCNKSEVLSLASWDRENSRIHRAEKASKARNRWPQIHRELGQEPKSTMGAVGFLRAQGGGWRGTFKEYEVLCVPQWWRAGPTCMKLLCSISSLSRKKTDLLIPSIADSKRAVYRSRLAQEIQGQMGKFSFHGGFQALIPPDTGLCIHMRDGSVSHVLFFHFTLYLRANSCESQSYT